MLSLILLIGLCSCGKKVDEMDQNNNDNQTVVDNQGSDEQTDKENNVDNSNSLEETENQGNLNNNINIEINNSDGSDTVDNNDFYTDIKDITYHITAKTEGSCQNDILFELGAGFEMDDSDITYTIWNITANIETVETPVHQWFLDKNMNKLEEEYSKMFNSDNLAVKEDSINTINLFGCVENFSVQYLSMYEDYPNRYGANVYFDIENREYWEDLANFIQDTTGVKCNEEFITVLYNSYVAESPTIIEILNEDNSIVISALIDEEYEGYFFVSVGNSPYI